MDKQDNGLNILKTKFTKDNKYYEVDYVPQCHKYTYRIFLITLERETFMKQFRTMKKCTATEIRNKAKAKV